MEETQRQGQQMHLPVGDGEGEGEGESEWSTNFAPFETKLASVSDKKLWQLEKEWRLMLWKTPEADVSE